MRCKTAPVSALLLSLSLLAGCDAAPPLDELPLRDALRAEPEVVASLAPDARLRLMRRLDEARSGEAEGDHLTTVEAPPLVLLNALDEARARRSTDAMVVGAVTAAGEVLPMPLLDPAAPLPPLAGPPASAATAPVETYALAGRAGATLRALLRISGAHHLERVVGWPVGAVALHDTVYVSGSWLVALAVDEQPAQTDAGADGGSASGAAGSGGAPPYSPWPDGGPVWTPPPPVYIPPSPPPPTPPAPEGDACGEACAAFALGCHAADQTNASGYGYGSQSGCEPTQDDRDACNQSEGSSDSCQSNNEDKGCSSNSESGSKSNSCDVGRRGPRPASATLVTVLLPFGYLLRQRRR